MSTRAVAVHLLDNRDKLGSGLILIFSLCYLRYSFDIPLDPVAGEEFISSRSLPLGLALASILCCLIQLGLPPREGAQLSLRCAVKGFRWGPTAALIGLMMAYSLAFSFLGFLLATFLFLLAGFSVLGERRWLLALAVSGGLAGFMWVLLGQVFGLYLEAGVLLRALVGEG